MELLDGVVELDQQTSALPTIRQHASMNNAEYRATAEELTQKLRERELQTLISQFDRALNNEEVKREVSSIFGKFTLLQRVMQSMG